MGRLPAALLALLLLPGAAAARDCEAPQPVCAAAASVFALSGFSPVGSAVRIGPGLLVTSRHVVADETEVVLFLPDRTPLAAEVVPGDFEDDLVLLRAVLPEGPSLQPAQTAPKPPLYAIGADLAAGRVRVFAPGPLHALPAEGLPRARLHHGAESRPGTSGGALLDAAGRLQGFLAAGGEGRNEAIPAERLAALQAASGPGAGARGAEIGQAVRACQEGLEALSGQRPLAREAAAALEADCRATLNRQFWDEAAQVLAIGGHRAEAVGLFADGLAADPEALNTRIGYAVALHLDGRWGEGLENLAWLLQRLPRDPQVLRLAVQAGAWGGDRDLAERAYALLAEHHPAQAEAARRFLDSDSPPPRLPQ